MRTTVVLPHKAIFFLVEAILEAEEDDSIVSLLEFYQEVLGFYEVEVCHGLTPPIRTSLRRCRACRGSARP